MFDLPPNLTMLILSALLLGTLLVLLAMGQHFFGLVVAGCLAATVGAASLRHLRARPTSA